MSFKQHDKREVISSKVNGFTSARRSGIWRGSNVFLGLLVCHRCFGARSTAAQYLLASRNVRFGSLADIEALSPDVRFPPQKRT